MAIWVILTTCLIHSNHVSRNYERRRVEYIKCINNYIKLFEGYNIVIVENNSMVNKLFSFGVHQTFLDRFKIPVLYTTTNRIQTRNYGMKELLDIRECIKKFNIQDDDFIIKATGRYFLKENSNFANEVKRLNETNYDAIIRYGAYYLDALDKSDNCVTGLIGLRCKYVKEIEIPDEDTFVEMKWAKRIGELDDSKVCVLKELGIYIRPAVHEEYFLV